MKGYGVDSANYALYFTPPYSEKNEPIEVYPQQNLNSLEHYLFNWRVHHLEFKTKVDTEQLIEAKARAAFAPKDTPDLLPGDEITHKIVGVDYVNGTTRELGTLFLSKFQLVFISSNTVIFSLVFLIIFLNSFPSSHRMQD